MPRPTHRTRVLLRAVVATASLIVLAGSGIAWATYQGLTATTARGQRVPATADSDGAAQNILLLGNDSRAGASPAELQALSTDEDGGTVNTDTMMLMHIPADGSKASIISFPRDSWVSIPGYGNAKLNAAYPDGYNAAKATGADESDAQSAGADTLILTLSALTGLHIDHWIQVNLLGFYRISEAIGGVPVCLINAQNPQTDSDAYGSGYSGIDLPAGRSVIEGKQALAFVRQRHGLPNGDLDRVRRQQYFLSAAFAKISSSSVLLNPFKLNALINAVGASILTDRDLVLTSLGNELAQLSSGNLSFQTLPNKGAQTIYPDGVETSIVAVDTAAIPSFIASITGTAVDSALSRAKAADPAGVTLDVYNGTDTEGLAAANATALKAKGFHVDTVDSVDPTATTVVQYPAGMEAAAKAVAAQIPGVALAETASIPRVRLVLGGDGKGFGPKPVTAAPAATGAPRTAAAAPAALGCIN